MSMNKMFKKCSQLIAAGAMTMGMAMPNICGQMGQDNRALDY